MGTKGQELESTDQKIKKPSKYMVIMFNDNKTTFEFVIAVLCTVFNKDIQTAEALAHEIHEKGESVVGKNYSFEVAKNKVNKALDLAKANGFPLNCIYKEQ